MAVALVPGVVWLVVSAVAACGFVVMRRAAYLAVALWLPDPAVTPGAVDTSVTQSNIQQTICVPGYATAHRPPKDVTEAIKRRQITAPRYLDKQLGHYEEDHLIPLSLGGSSDPANLWPEAWAGVCGAHTKDALEWRLHDLVCDGAVALGDAQHAIATDWVAAYQRFVGPLRCQ